MIIDDQTGSIWNVFGTAMSGWGTQLQQVNAYPHFWFAWAAFNLESDEVISRYKLDSILGNPDAPVKIIEYGAYSCSSCKFLA